MKVNDACPLLSILPKLDLSTQRDWLWALEFTLRVGIADHRVRRTSMGLVKFRSFVSDGCVPGTWTKAQFNILWSVYCAPFRGKDGRL